MFQEWTAALGLFQNLWSIISGTFHCRFHPGSFHIEGGRKIFHGFNFFIQRLPIFSCIIIQTWVFHQFLANITLASFSAIHSAFWVQLLPMLFPVQYRYGSNYPSFLSHIQNWRLCYKAIAASPRSGSRWLGCQHEVALGVCVICSVDDSLVGFRALAAALDSDKAQFSRFGDLPHAPSRRYHTRACRTYILVNRVAYLAETTTYLLHRRRLVVYKIYALRLGCINTTRS